MIDRTFDIFRSLNSGTKFNRKRFAEDISLFEKRSKEDGEEEKIGNSNLSDPLNFFKPFITKPLLTKETTAKDIQGKLVSEEKNDKIISKSSDQDDKTNKPETMLNSLESIEKVELSGNNCFLMEFIGAMPNKRLMEA